MSEIAAERKAGLIKNKILLWENTVYDAQLDAEIDEMLGDEQGLAQAKTRMKNALKAIGLLEEKLSEFVA